MSTNHIWCLRPQPAFSLYSTECSDVDMMLLGKEKSQSAQGSLAGVRVGYSVQDCCRYSLFRQKPGQLRDNLFHAAYI